MGLRVTTWNVNGIRNPFSYQPWREKRTFSGMFDILEADIVIMQELKIQRKDLRDDMVLIPGWDCYFSLPKHKKGYSGVGIYTRNSVCAPIKAEEGLLGVLCPPNSKVSYRDLPENEHIGGYPTPEQLEALNIDDAALDAEGRCMILEFPAFVLFGIYAPANSSGQRDDFRYGFHSALDIRIRNLIALGKSVVVTGDLNVSRGELDTANALESMRKEGISHEAYVSTPNRRIFNQLLEGGDVIGERDTGREQPVLWDTCRGFHPDRKGMYTHWEQKINARPGNFGSRIDFILCSLDMKSWFLTADIQEGLMGSDHCPVYAVLKDCITLNGREVSIRDIMNPSGTFEDGRRLMEWTIKNVPPTSGRLLTEFDKRRSIKDMFGQQSAAHSSYKPSQVASAPEPTSARIGIAEIKKAVIPVARKSRSADMPGLRKGANASSQSSTAASSKLKRPATDTSHGQETRRIKLDEAIPSNIAASNGQQTLKGFLKPVQSVRNSKAGDCEISNDHTLQYDFIDTSDAKSTQGVEIPVDKEPPSAEWEHEYFVDPIVSKESWGKLFARPTLPRCEHGEPCQSMKTKVKGFNCGREFWMCARPLGPSGSKENGTQWRCKTFLWSSDWNTSTGT